MVGIPLFSILGGSEFPRGNECLCNAPFDVMHDDDTTVSSQKTIQQVSHHMFKISMMTVPLLSFLGHECYLLQVNRFWIIWEILLRFCSEEGLRRPFPIEIQNAVY